MTVFVVDASVAPKWFLPENHTEAANRLRSSAYRLHVPCFFDIEIANVLWKKIRRGEITRDEGDDIMIKLGQWPVTRHPDAPLLVTAFDIANLMQRTVYDCVYLVLAQVLGGKMVTLTND